MIVGGHIIIGMLIEEGVSAIMSTGDMGVIKVWGSPVAMSLLNRSIITREEEGLETAGPRRFSINFL